MRAIAHLLTDVQIWPIGGCEQQEWVSCKYDLIVDVTK